eukprot:CAMPEP_0181435724 /NCGR_PEP_ID=MMETSP1110-20121109/20481_1 /TAXON_ID=174948 /ORGANISM="Symbiodinium sp., Strain CCMP421" /LENGTH=74 /DNA_ID=CAMNT_0023559269 /DNA_START=427 /DNA_END=652 /DNA_ORIENTATION=-
MRKLHRLAAAPPRANAGVNKRKAPAKGRRYPSVAMLREEHLASASRSVAEVLPVSDDTSATACGEVRNKLKCTH